MSMEAVLLSSSLTLHRYLPSEIIICQAILIPFSTQFFNNWLQINLISQTHTTSCQLIVFCAIFFVVAVIISLSKHLIDLQGKKLEIQRQGLTVKFIVILLKINNIIIVIIITVIIMNNPWSANGLKKRIYFVNKNIDPIRVSYLTYLTTCAIKPLRNKYSLVQKDRL